MTQTQLTPRSALGYGLLCILCGLWSVLGALGVIGSHVDPGVPQWIGVAVGSTFLLAGVALFVDAAAGGTNPDGTLPATASPALKHLQSAVGLSIVVMMGAIASWIAFGKGERHFSTTISVPFFWYRPKSNDTLGRIAFGTAAVMIWFIVILGVGAAMKRHVARLRST